MRKRLCCSNRYTISKNALARSGVLPKMNQPLPLQTLVRRLARSLTRWRIAWLGMVLVLVGGLAIGRLQALPHPDPSPSPRQFPKTFWKEPFEVAEGVYVLGSLSPSVAYVVGTSEGLILIDSGLDESSIGVLGQMDALGLNHKELKKILLTHAHGDHTLGAKRLKELTGALIYAGRGDGNVLRRGGPREAFFSTFYMPGVSAHSVPIDVELDGDTAITLGDTKIQALATPGHTPGSTCYLLERSGKRILFTGDTISSISAEIGTYAVYLSPRHRGDARAYLKTLERLEAMPPPDIVLPGHPRQGRAADATRIDKQTWQRLLSRGKKDVKAAITRFNRDGADFLDGQPKEIVPRIYYLGDRDNDPVYCLAAERGLIVFDAPGGAGLEAWVRDRMKPLLKHELPIKYVVLTSLDPSATRALEASEQMVNIRLAVDEVNLNDTRRRFGSRYEVRSVQSIAREFDQKIQSIAAPGRLAGGAVYVLQSDKHVVCFSGKHLFRLERYNVQALLSALTTGHGDVEQYLQLLDRLAKIEPDVWLPAVSVKDQNAHLYNDEWKKLVEDVRAVVEFWSKHQHGPQKR